MQRRTYRYLTVDGMHAGTGIRDPYPEDFSYLEPEVLGVSTELIRRIRRWVDDYRAAFFCHFDNEEEVRLLDKEGLSIRDALAEEYPHAKIGYFSDALMKKVPEL